MNLQPPIGSLIINGETIHRPMMTQANEESAAYYSADWQRVDFFEKRLVVITRLDLGKVFLLNLDKKEYMVKAPTPDVFGGVTVRVSRSPEARPNVNIVEADPKLFEVPPGFREVDAFSAIPE